MKSFYKTLGGDISHPTEEDVIHLTRVTMSTLPKGFDVPTVIQNCSRFRGEWAYQ